MCSASGRPTRRSQRRLSVPIRSRIRRAARRPALGIVLVRARGAEDRHDRIAHELLDEALVALDRDRHLAEEVGLDRAHLLGIESFAERGEPGQVREENGDRAAVALGRGGRGGRRRRFGGGGKPGSALGAEREVGGRFEAAAAGHVDGATLRSTSDTANTRCRRRLRTMSLIVRGTPRSPPDRVHDRPTRRRGALLPRACPRQARARPPSPGRSLPPGITRWRRALSRASRAGRRPPC